MNDHDYLEEYLNEEEPKTEELENENTGILDSITPNNVVEFPKNPSVSIEKGPKVTEIIEEGKKHQSKLVEKGIKVKKKTENVLGTAVPSLDDIPIPTGGIGLLVFISLLVVFAITPVNGGSGLTRLQLLWQAVLGNYTLNGNGAGVTHESAGPQTTNFTPVSTVPGLSSFMQGGMM